MSAHVSPDQLAAALRELLPLVPFDGNHADELAKGRQLNNARRLLGAWDAQQLRELNERDERRKLDAMTEREIARYAIANGWRPRPRLVTHVKRLAVSVESRLRRLANGSTTEEAQRGWINSECRDAMNTAVRAYAEGMPR